MKKTLAIVLSLLVAFSMFSVAVSAADATEIQKEKTIKFVVRGQETRIVVINESNPFSADLFPEIPGEQDFNEVQSDGTVKTYRYKFIGWESGIDKQIYYRGTFNPNDDVHKNASVITLTARFAVEDISERQTLWQLIESIFARINLIFEYFATIFNF